jgi:hypothetical protein
MQLAWLLAVIMCASGCRTWRAVPSGDVEREIRKAISDGKRLSFTNNEGLVAEVTPKSISYPYVRAKHFDGMNTQVDLRDVRSVSVKRINPKATAAVVTISVLAGAALIGLACWGMSQMEINIGRM